MPHVAVQAAYVAFRKTGLNAICALWYARNVASPQVPLHDVVRCAAGYYWQAWDRTDPRATWAAAYHAARNGGLH